LIAIGTFRHFVATRQFGRFRSEADILGITTVDSAWHPSWLGTEQTGYFKHDGDALSLMSDFIELPKFPGRRVRGTAIWRREV
jgi:hypothetical protein